MGAALPEISFAAFAAGIEARAPALGPQVPRALYVHYQLLRRWNRRLSLIGPGSADRAETVLDRHYGESLAALPLLRPSDRTLVDIGSGAGFPGLVLAAALAQARPALEVVLVEPRQRKWSFLKAAVRQMAATLDAGWSCRCLDARIAGPLPAGLPAAIDVVTSRAVSLEGELLQPFLERSPGVRFLLWQGGSGARHRGLRCSRTRALGGSRRIVELVGSGA